MYLGNVDFAFYKNFISGDLLLLGTLLFIGITVEIHSELKEWKTSSAIESVDPSDRLDKLYTHSLFLAWAFGAIFWCVKLKSINYEFPTLGSTPLPIDIRISVWASIAGGFLALIWSYGASKKVYNIFLDAELRELSLGGEQKKTDKV